MYPNGNNKAELALQLPEIGANQKVKEVDFQLALLPQNSRQSHNDKDQQKPHENPLLSLMQKANETVAQQDNTLVNAASIRDRYPKFATHKNSIQHIDV